MNKGLHVYAQSPHIFKDLGDINLIEHRIKKITNNKDLIISLRNGEKINHNGVAFDEILYLKLNPDVKIAVTNGLFEGGYDHYRKFGQFEKRKISNDN